MSELPINLFLVFSVGSVSWYVWLFLVEYWTSQKIAVLWSFWVPVESWWYLVILLYLAGPQTPVFIFPARWDRLFLLSFSVPQLLNSINFSFLWLGLLMNQWVLCEEGQLRLLDSFLGAFLLTRILAPQVLVALLVLEFQFLSSQPGHTDLGYF